MQLNASNSIFAAGVVFANKRCCCISTQTIVLEGHLPLAGWIVSGDHSAVRLSNRVTEIISHQEVMEVINRIGVLKCLEKIG